MVDCTAESVVDIVAVNDTGETIVISYEVSREGEPFGGEGFDVPPNSARTSSTGYSPPFSITVWHGDDELLTQIVPACPTVPAPDVSAFSYQTCAPTPDMRVYAVNNGTADGTIRYTKLDGETVVDSGSLTVASGEYVDMSTGFGDGPFTIVLTDEDGAVIEQFDVDSCQDPVPNPYDFWATVEVVCLDGVGASITVGNIAVFEPGTATIEQIRDGVTISSQTIDVPGGESVVTRFAPEIVPYEINVIQYGRVTHTFTVEPCEPVLG